ncbi:MAG: putative transcriptional regulator, PucR family [Firmicutes bacterium]|nr:putative transcriptional regulator, PucR family [Bacillota bacterium]
MKLCIGMIEDGLNQRHLYKNFTGENDPFDLERFEIYCKSTYLCTGVIYLTLGSSLPDELIVQDRAAMISLGMPPSFYTKAPLRLLVIEENMELAELSNEVGRIFFEYNALEQRLQDSVNDGRSIQYLVDQFAPYIKNSISVLNSEFRMLATSHGPEADEKILEILSLTDTGMILPEIVKFFKNDTNYAEAKKRRGPFIYEASIFPWPTLCMNIYHHNEYVARVTISENQNPFREYEAELLNFFTSFIQRIYNFSETVGDIMPHHLMAELCVILLQGKTVESGRLCGCLLNRGWEINDSYLCACVLPSERDYYNRTVTYYARLISQEYPGSYAFEFNQKIMIVINLKYYDNSDETFIHSKIEVMRDLYFRIGFSNPFHNFEELKAYYTQAEIALRVGLEYYPLLWYHRFSDRALLYMLSRLKGELDEKYICSQELLTLEQYDKENQTDYLHTLRTYLDNGMNTVQTANALFIHRATMIYRLDRIKILTKINFKDPERMLGISISLRLIENAKSHIPEIE